MRSCQPGALLALRNTAIINIRYMEAMMTYAVNDWISQNSQKTIIQPMIIISAREEQLHPSRNPIAIP